MKLDGFEGGRVKDCSITIGQPTGGWSKGEKISGGHREGRGRVEGEKQENDCPCPSVGPAVMKDGRKGWGSRNSLKLNSFAQIESGRSHLLLRGKGGREINFSTQGVPWFISSRGLHLNDQVANAYQHSVQRL